MVSYIKMKLNIFPPGTEYQKLIEADFMNTNFKLFYEKCIATELAADSLGEDR